MAKTRSKKPDIVNFSLAGLKWRFSRTDKLLRPLSIAPPGAQMGPDVTGGARWERTGVLVQLRQCGRLGHFGARAVHTQPALSMQLVSIKQIGSPSTGAIVAKCREQDTGLEVILRYQAVGAKGAVRVELEARNRGAKPIVVEQLLVCMAGLGRSDNEDWGHTTEIHAARNTWFGEAQWNTSTPSRLGIADTRPPFGDTLGAAVWRNLGTWSTSNDLPMGVLSDRDTGLSWFWQIEHSASWQMEVGRLGRAFYVAGGLPSARHGDWYVTLKPGQSYQAAPMAFGCVEGGFTEAIAALQGYRRKACRPDSDADKKLPVFFNDYMNCLDGNPTEETEIPMVDAAAAAGAEYFVIDAGWFEPRTKTWGSTLGDWRESPDRFPRGLAWLCDYIRSKGMRPGLWAEIECVSPKAKLASKPDRWFVCANGRRVNVGGRMFLNFANEQVRKYCTDVVRRLDRDYGMRYIKLDYNADSGLGDNRIQPSLGAGQTANIRGFYQWLDDIRAAVPELIVENCGSGGQRFEYGLLRHTHVQSTSDQTDYRRYPSIMAGCLAAGLPEQMCCWSYPLEGQNDEAICFNLVTPMLSRWHLSGRIDRIGESGGALVRQATDLWKRRVRANIPKMTPFWPTPFRHLHEQDCWLAAGLSNPAGAKAFVTVFRLNSPDDTVELPLDRLKLAGAEARILFPTHLGGQVKLSRRAGTLRVTLPNPYSARLIEISAGRK